MSLTHNPLQLPTIIRSNGPTIIPVHKIYVTAINLDGGDLWWSRVVGILLVIGGLKLVITHV